MKKKRKKLTACALVAVLGLSFSVYPVYAQEEPTTEQADTGGLLELDETAVSMEDTATEKPVNAESDTEEQKNQSDTEDSKPTSQEQPESKDTIEEIVGEPKQSEAITEVQPYAENNAGSFNVVGGMSGTDWTYDSENSILTFNTGGNYTVTGDGNSTQEKIKINSGFKGSITIKNINIGLNETYGGYAFEVAENAELTLTLEGTNYFKSWGYSAGLKITNSSVTINGTGSLELKSESWGEGIGISDGALTINGGIIKANGGDGYAGIGGSNATIIINDGNITANGHMGGAGIGQNKNSSSTVAITINGGTVKATASAYWGTPDEIGKSIGYGYNGSGNVTVTINGGIVETPNGISPAPPAPIPTFTTTQTASSITVKALDNQEIFGTAEYSLNGTNWQDSNIFNNLHSAEYGGNYTVYARYKGNDSYLQSEAGTLSVSTNSASYTITIPADPNNPLEAGNADSISTISANQDQPFDLGYNGQVDVKIKKDDKVTDKAELKLTRQNDTGNHTITSALLVNGTALGNINTSVATFKNKSDSPVSVSFEKPTEANIPAGTYNGTITFEVSYSEQ